MIVSCTVGWYSIVLCGRFLPDYTPDHIRSDIGLEIIAKRVMGWLGGLQVRHKHIEPRSASPLGRIAILNHLIGSHGMNY